ncbi:MAG: GMC oxidoreductase [Actinomycetota bacterium]
MKPTDLRDHEHDTQLATDVCVIGSGPAGAIVALELASAGVDVVIVESGGWDVEPETNALYELDNVGLPRLPQDEIRVRQIGGSATQWTGRSAPFRQIDFETRPWVPMSGWPITLDELEPHLGRASRFLGYAPMRYDRDIWRAFDGNRPGPTLDPSQLVDEIWQFSKGREPGQPMRVNIDLRDRIENEPHLRVLFHANVLDIVPSDNGRRVDHVQLSTLEGKRGTVTAQTVVVAAGGIETARLLLASRSVVPTGLGNDRDLVGRYYAEHPYCEVGTFSIDDDWDALLTRFGNHWYTHPGGKQVFMSGLALSPKVQRERELLNACMYVLSEDDENAAVHAARRLATGTGDTAADVKALLSRPMELAEAARRRQLEGLPPIVPPTRIALGVNAEQRPDPESRITLSDRTDALGMPLTRMNWRMDDQEIATIRTMFEIVAAEFGRVGLPQPTASPWLYDEDWRGHVVDTAHHSCSVRMASDPSRGVTDPWGHVFGVDGLYVAGSALFPTVGTANPTLMLTALAARVADAVRARHTAAAPTVESAPDTWARPRTRTRIGLVGVDDRVEATYAPALRALAGDVEVVGVTAQDTDLAGRAAGALKTVAHDSLPAMLETSQPDALIGVLPGETSPELLGTARPVLVEPPWAWSPRDGERLLDAVEPTALVGVAERHPFLPLERLRARIIEEGLLGRVQAVHNDGEVWDFHGIAVTRRMLSPLTRPVSVQSTGFEPLLASPTEPAAPRPAYNATIAFADGSSITQRFIAGVDGPLRFGRRLMVEGSNGTVSGDELRFIAADGQIVRTQLRRVTADGELTAMEVDCGPNGLLRWANPWVGHGLNDEQIATAAHVDALARSAQGTASPLYSAADAQLDLQIMAAIDASSRHGGSVRLPYRAAVERARMAADVGRAAAGLRKVTDSLRSRLGR